MTTLIYTGNDDEYMQPARLAGCVGSRAKLKRRRQQTNALARRCVFTYTARYMYRRCSVGEEYKQSWGGRVDNFLPEICQLDPSSLL